MGSLANLYGFQAMAWVYSDAAMQRYAVLRPGGDGISVDVVHCGHKWAVHTRCFQLPFRGLGRDRCMASLADLFTF